MRSLCIIVPKEKVNDARKELKSLCLLRNDLKMFHEGGLFFIPVPEDPGLGFELAEKEFEEEKMRPRSYRELVEVPENLRKHLPTSFDVVGSIAVMKLDDSIIPYRKEIGKAIIKCHKNIKTVALDRGVEGERRLRDIEVIAGQGTTETVHREHGLTFVLDISKVYFSPRLATERMRVAEGVRPGEVVLDMFAGIGPFSILIARYGRPKRVYAIDINPHAIEYMKRNILKNKVSGVIPLLGDARQEVNKIREKCDRLIMNLPFSSSEFFEDALSVLADNGKIHYYEIMERTDVGSRMADLKSKAEDDGRELVLERLEEAKTYSPTMTYYSMDLRLPVH